MITVLSIAYPFAPVGPDAVGGAEQVLSAIDHALVAAGHRSLVVAASGSRTAGKLLPVSQPAAGIDERVRQSVYTNVRRVVAGAVQAADIVHMHGVDFHEYLPPPGKPALVTLHLPPDWYPAGALPPPRPRTWLNCVSTSQQKACPPNLKLLPPVPNGVPVHALTPANQPCGGYAVMLGRICPEKGQHLGLAAAREAGVTALLAGEVFPYPEHQAYFQDCVRPLLDRRRRFVGPVDFIRKRRLLATARCLLVPSLAAETSSLVAMEALACGTPVIAFPSGALSDIVEHGRTGFLVGGPSEMAAAIARVSEINRETCRAAAEKRFPLERMTKSYMGLYGRLLACR
ncbi:MAG TPA: glycosyltransferase [Rhodopila sp.]|nr:glycosyltransferase [Rhodopila sp.]